VSDHQTDSEFVAHVPCGSCGSSDANSLYTDGHTYCFACRAYGRGDGSQRPAPQRSNPNLIPELTFQSLERRKLSEESCRKWGYGTATHSGSPVQVANYYTPDGSKLVAQKVRYPDKKFCVLGDMKEAGLYGQHLWRDGGKYVVITEGEIDAISVSQVFEHKYPVVSIPTGSSGARKALGKSSDWLEKFETVVLMFDMDEPGQAAVSECIDILSPGKVKVASLPLKDANDMLKAGRGAEIVQAFWSAKAARPDGIVAGTDLWEVITQEQKPGEAVPFPYSKLQAMTLGMRKGEVIMFASGTGMGKSECVRQIYTYLLLQHGETLGLIHLEEKLKKTSEAMMGLYLGRRLNLDRTGVTPEKLREAFDATVGSGRVFLYDHFGSADSENLFNKIRYFARGCGCTTVVLDHISMIVSGIEDGDERRIIDNLMTKLATLAQELNIRIVTITHLKKPMGKPHEEGGHVSLDDFRGSGTIKQLTHTAIGLERNQQDEQRKHYTRLRLLKCRETGETGEAGWLFYEKDSGRLREVEEPVFQDETKTADDGEKKDF
jgi:twinkle protein